MRGQRHRAPRESLPSGPQEPTAAYKAETENADGLARQSERLTVPLAGPGQHSPVIRDGPVIRDVAKNDKLRFEAALPFRPVAGEEGRATTSIRSMLSRKMRYRWRPPLLWR